MNMLVRHFIQVREALYLAYTQGNWHLREEGGRPNDRNDGPTSRTCLYMHDAYLHVAQEYGKRRHAMRPQLPEIILLTNDTDDGQEAAKAGISSISVPQMLRG
ncbi:hypothetical protein FPV67DRAFT_222404 [Lyophyllum atratum]|nr:hypothetical protein FPV67DRAFT_222404 [Lyophyllum atratum]